MMDHMDWDIALRAEILWADFCRVILPGGLRAKVVRFIHNPVPYFVQYFRKMIRVLKRVAPVVRTRRRMVHFVHRRDRHNAGDMASCPYYYFQEFKRCRCKVHDIHDMDFRWILKTDVVILGGGGLFDCMDEWNLVINRLLQQCDNVIAWGVGFNEHYDRKCLTKIAFERFKILTIRDKNHPSGFEYVPCVSCMTPRIDLCYKETRSVGAVVHRSFVLQTRCDKITNDCSVNAMISFIASSRKIITNSYHAAYFARLLGKKIELRNAFSTKFEFMGDDCLCQCREKNRQMMKRVAEVIGL